jgi:hypothetical protein
MGYPLLNLCPNGHRQLRGLPIDIAVSRPRGIQSNTRASTARRVKLRTGCRDLRIGKDFAARGSSQLTIH